jgi:ankyrin repeat protein
MPEMPERLARIERLLQSGVRLAERDKNDPELKGLLIDALKNAPLQVVPILWVAGVADQTNRTGNSALVSAAQFGHNEMVEVLIEYGA